MTDHEASLWRQAAEELETAIHLAAGCRYRELAEHAARMEHASSALQQCTRSLQTDGPPAENVRATAGRLRRKTFALSEILHHTRVVQASLLQMGAEVRLAYNREGAFGAADRIRLDEEA